MYTNRKQEKWIIIILRYIAQTYYKFYTTYLFMVYLCFTIHNTMRVISHYNLL